jgi:hypothetical protein
VISILSDYSFSGFDILCRLIDRYRSDHRISHRTTGFGRRTFDTNQVSKITITRVHRSAQRCVVSSILFRTGNAYVLLLTERKSLNRSKPKLAKFIKTSRARRVRKLIKVCGRVASPHMSEIVVLQIILSRMHAQPTKDV